MSDTPPVDAFPIARGDDLAAAISCWERLGFAGRGQGIDAHLYQANDSRIAILARSSLDLVAGTERPRYSAVSATEQ